MGNRATTAARTVARAARDEAATKIDPIKVAASQTVLKSEQVAATSAYFFLCLFAFMNPTTDAWQSFRLTIYLPKRLRRPPQVRYCYRFTGKSVAERLCAM